MDLAKCDCLILSIMPKGLQPIPAENRLNKGAVWTALFQSSWETVFVSNTKEEPYLNSDARAQRVYLSQWFFLHSSFPHFCTDPDCLTVLTGHCPAHGVLQNKWKRKDSC